MASVRPAPRPGVKSIPVKQTTYIITRRAASPLVSWDISEPAKSVEDLSIMIYGPPGIGKTSLIAQLSNVMFLTWERAGTGIRARRTRLLQTWSEALDAKKEIIANAKRLNAVCHDTSPAGYKVCQDYVCRLKGIEHPHDANDFGATYEAVTNAWRKMQADFDVAGLSVYMIAHDKLEEIETFNGKKTFQVKPTVSGKLEQYCKETTDFIGYYHMIGQKRFLQIVGDQYVWAKSNADEHWRTENGERIHRIPMGNSPAEAAENIRKAFHNQQQEAYNEVGVFFEASERPNKPGKFDKPRKIVKGKV